MYRESQFGGIDKTTDGLNFSGVESGNGNGGWVTPYMLFPNNNNRLLIGREDMNIVDFTNNTFGTRTVRNNPLRHDPSGLGENVIQAITMSESNENVVYTSYQFGRAITNPNNPNAIDRCLFRSTNGGVNWTDISPINFTYPNAPINSILVHPNNPNKIWIARGGYDGSPVLTSNDGGTTWVDYSQGLGFMPATCIVINPNRANDEEIYLATDVGVFYRNKYMSQWECFNGLLPNVRVSDLKVNKHRKTLYAATYGRGIWRTSLFCPTVLSYTLPTSPLNFYAASSFISSSSIIDGGRDVAYRAPSIYLTSGFKVVLGTRFTANSYSCAAYVSNRIVQNNSNTDELPQIKQKQEKGENLLAFSVSPTPTSSNIKIDYNLEEKGNTYIYLTDIRGKLVKNLYRESQQEAGKYNLSFNLSDVQNGIYFVVMQNDETTTYKKVIIQK